MEEDSIVKGIIRGFARLEDRKTPCIVQANFSHWCQEHKRSTCATKKPPHCAVDCDLVKMKRDLVVMDGKKGLQLVNEKSYCRECAGPVVGMQHLLPIPVHKINISKKTPEEIAKMIQDDFPKYIGFET